MTTASALAPAEGAAAAALARGRESYRQRRTVEAVAAFDAALVTAGGRDEGLRAEILFWRGLARLQEGREAEGTDNLEAAAGAGWLEARFQLAQLYARQGRRRGALRQRAIDHLQHILDCAGEGDATLAAGRDRVCFVLGGLHAEGDGAGDVEFGIAAYRLGLAANPLSAVGHCGLGQLLMRAGQPLGALGEFKVALQLDPDARAAYANLARLLFQNAKATDLATEYAHIVDEFGETAPTVLARLSQELVELGREQVYRGLYTKGHQLKNLIGLVGSRLRRVARQFDREPDPAAAGEELAQLAGEHERLYEEWVGYLSAMAPDRLVTGLVEPARIARRVAEALAAEHPGPLEVRVQEGVPRIEADERLVRDAVTNLCMNAVQAAAAVTPRGEVTLGVGFDAESGVVFIEVEDTGPGIPPEVIDHVFDPGYTTKAQGNGYGLAIARRIAHAHHGDLRVKSRVGRGTVFRLDLPVNFDADSAPESLAGSPL